MLDEAMSAYVQKEKEVDKDDDKKGATANRALTWHHAALLIIYLVCIALSVSILMTNDAKASLEALLSTGAILATFGAAIGALGSVWERDLLERVLLNVDVLYKDILEQTEQWRRWPFLPRNGDRKRLDKGTIRLALHNPRLPLSVGTHIIEPEVPTVLEDFFDLPLMANLIPLVRFQRAVHTTLGRRKSDVVDDETGLTPHTEYMAFLCLRDVWISILKFRVARYFVHFGAALTIAGTLTTASEFLCLNSKDAWNTHAHPYVTYEFKVDSFGSRVERSVQHSLP